MMTPIVTIHVLTWGYAACRFTGLLPRYWPEWNIWIHLSEVEAIRAAIDDHDSELCSVLPYVLCDRCDAVLNDPALEGERPNAKEYCIVYGDRRCARCGLSMSIWWPALFCSSRCALWNVLRPQ